MNTFFHFRFLTLIALLIFPFVLSAQLLEMDFSEKAPTEQSVRVHFIRYGIIGVSSLKHFDLTAEILKIRYKGRRSGQYSFTIYSTKTIWQGNKDDQLNRFDNLMHPIGGTLNGSFFAGIPLSSKSQNSKLALVLGKKWIQAEPITPNYSKSFFDNYGRLGWSYQKLLAEDPLTNSSLSFWGFPHAQFHQSSAESRAAFFRNELYSFAYGYGAELGLEYNSQLKLILHGQQLLSASAQNKLKHPVFRLTLAYRF